MKRRKPVAPDELLMVCLPAQDSDTGRDEIYIELDGKRIARRGYSDTSQARTWVSLEPGYQVLDGEDRPDGGGEIVVTHNGVPIH